MVRFLLDVSEWRLKGGVGLAWQTACLDTHVGTSPFRWWAGDEFWMFVLRFMTVVFSSVLWLKGSCGDMSLLSVKGKLFASCPNFAFWLQFYFPKWDSYQTLCYTHAMEFISETLLHNQGTPNLHEYVLQDQTNTGVIKLESETQLFIIVHTCLYHSVNWGKIGPVWNLCAGVGLVTQRGIPEGSCVCVCVCVCVWCVYCSGSVCVAAFVWGYMQVCTFVVCVLRVTAL